MNIIDKQATTIIGTLGHVAHGKSTLVQALTGIKTQKHSTEKQRNITVNLGYADFKVWKCDQCPKPKCFSSSGSDVFEKKCDHCERQVKLIRHFSFVDCPGHEQLMSTMLSGSCVMHGALLIIAANQEVPQPQTEEHFKVLKQIGIPFLTVQTKLDLVSKEKAMTNFNQIKEFTGSKIVIPTVASNNMNIDILLEFMCSAFPEPKVDTTSSFRSNKIIRSFNINRPASSVNDLKGGVIGCTLKQGTLKIGDKIEIRPGLITKDNKGRICATPLTAKVISLRCENNDLEIACPGGLIAIGTNLDPSITKSNFLVGQVFGKPGTLPDITNKLKMKETLFKTVKNKSVITNTLTKATETQLIDVKVSPLKNNEKLILNISATTVRATFKDGIFHLEEPVCCEKGQTASLFRGRKLIGFAKTL